MITEEQADKINRAAKFLPRTTDDELPALFIDGALVFVYVEPDDRGRPVLRLSVDTDDIAGSTLVEDGAVRVRLDVNNDLAEYAKSIPV